MEGEGPIDVAHRIIQPSQDDQHSTHAVQETVLHQPASVLLIGVK